MDLILKLFSPSFAIVLYAQNFFQGVEFWLFFFGYCFIFQFKIVRDHGLYENSISYRVVHPNIDDDGNAAAGHFAFRRNETHWVAMMFLMPH